MTETFQEGMTSLQVCQMIVRNHPSIISLRLISHVVGKNWRQINVTKEQKMEDLAAAFDHGGQTGERSYARDQFLELKQLDELPDGQVWSFSSKVGCSDGKCRHIAMMNFHPETDNLRLDDIRRIIQYLCGGGHGALLETGRYYHYYGNSLLEEEAWYRWMANFLMPCVVSPRYVGHMIFRGCCYLRLTADSTHKPKIPIVVEKV